MRIDKVKWITAHSCGKPKWHSFMLKRENFEPRHCLTKCALEKKTTEPKLLILVSFFISQETLSHTLIPVIASTYTVGSMPFRFFSFLATLYSKNFQSTKLQLIHPALIQYLSYQQKYKDSVSCVHFKRRAFCVSIFDFTHVFSILKNYVIDVHDNKFKSTICFEFLSKLEIIWIMFI